MRWECIRSGNSYYISTASLQLLCISPVGLVYMLSADHMQGAREIPSRDLSSKHYRIDDGEDVHTGWVQARYYLVIAHAVQPPKGCYTS